jgi:two-component system cell cycle response regulator DivK
MNKRILIVEDNALLREMYRSALKSLGAELIETQRGELVVQIAKSEQPRVIILDIVLPDIPGTEVIRRLKQEPGTKDIPVLAVTNAATTDDEAAMKAMGFAGLITKPIDLRRFPQTVGTYLSS